MADNYQPLLVITSAMKIPSIRHYLPSSSTTSIITLTTISNHRYHHLPLAIKIDHEQPAVTSITSTVNQLSTSFFRRSCGKVPSLGVPIRWMIIVGESWATPDVLMLVVLHIVVVGCSYSWCYHFYLFSTNNEINKMIFTLLRICFMRDNVCYLWMLILLCLLLYQQWLRAPMKDFIVSVQDGFCFACCLSLEMSLVA